jgi:hypothetical protein
MLPAADLLPQEYRPAAHERFDDFVSRHPATEGRLVQQRRGVKPGKLGGLSA